MFSKTDLGALFASFYFWFYFWFGCVRGPQESVLIKP